MKIKLAFFAPTHLPTARKSKNRKVMQEIYSPLYLLFSLSYLFILFLWSFYLICRDALNQFSCSFHITKRTYKFVRTKWYIDFRDYCYMIVENDPSSSDSIVYQICWHFATSSALFLVFLREILDILKSFHTGIKNYFIKQYEYKTSLSGLGRCENWKLRSEGGSKWLTLVN